MAARSGAPLAGIAGVGVFIAALVVAGQPGDREDGTSIAQYFADNRTQLLVSGWLAGLAIAGLLVWVWLLRPAFPGVASDFWTAIFGSVAALVGVELGTVAAEQALAFSSSEPVQPDVARAFYELSLAFSYASAFAGAVFTAFVAFAILNSMSILPRWLGWWAALLTLLALPGSARGLGLDVVAALPLCSGSSR